MDKIKNSINSARLSKLEQKTTALWVIAAGKAFLEMLGVFAEFETNLRKERQLEGIEKAKKEGKYKGRKATAQEKSDQVRDLTEKGMTRQAVAGGLGIGVASVYRILSNK